MRLFDWITRYAARAALLPILTLIAAGCNSVLDTTPDFADTARVVVTGTANAPLQMVASTNWLAGYNSETGDDVIMLVDSTVYDITLPVDTTFAFTNSRRFFVRIVNTDTTQTADLRLRVYLDKDLKTDQATTIKESPMQFSWLYLF